MLLTCSPSAIQTPQDLRKIDLTRAAACRRNPTICSSLNLLFFMSVILLVVDGLR